MRLTEIHDIDISRIKRFLESEPGQRLQAILGPDGPKADEYSVQYAAARRNLLAEGCTRTELSALAHYCNSLGSSSEFTLE